MSVLDDITSYQRDMEALVEDLPITDDELADAVVQAILDLLEDRTLSDLTEADLVDVTQRALDSATRTIDTQARQLVRDRVRQAVDRTREFYAAQGLDVPDSVREAARRSDDAQRLADLFEQGMQITIEDLRDETIDVVRDSIATGSISRDAISDAITSRLDVADHIARTQARTSISAYNQHYRNTLADEADLNHFLYSGTLKSNSRRFCRHHIDGVYTSEQISKMQNGQIEPVRQFQGGYNCRHSWLPVDPSWDDELSTSVVDTSQTSTIALGSDTDRSITVISNPQRDSQA